MAEWLVNRGHEVRVVAAPPYYPAWRIADGYTGWNYKKEVAGGAKVFRCPLWIPRKISGLNRLIHLSSFALTSFPVMFSQYFWRPHLVITIAPTFLSSLLCLVGSTLFKAKSWLHVQDFELDAAFNLGMFKMRKFRKPFTSLETFFLKRFDRISTISHQMAENLYHKGIKESRAILFPNWVDTEIIYPLIGSNPMREELLIPKDAIIALYAGNMGEKQGLDILAKVARKLEYHKKIKFIFGGEGSACSRLQNMTAKLTNVRFLPLQPSIRLNYLLNLADIHLLPQRADIAGLVMPSKLTGIFASGKPVIATARAGTEIARLVRNRGIVVEPNNAEKFSQSLLFLAQNPKERKRLGECGRAYAVKNLNKDEILCRFENDLYDLANDTKDSRKEVKKNPEEIKYPGLLCQFHKADS